MILKKLTPAVSRSTRLAIAGLVWTVVGAMLLTWAAGWLLHVPRGWAVSLGAVGVCIGLLAWRAMFSKLASDNAARMLRGSVRACLFGFTAPKGWLVTASMIVFGAALRHSALPKLWLAVPYAAIGTALLLASLTYYGHLPAASKEVTS